FYRVTGTKAPGTGIGLANVQRIVKAHGGHVLVQSKVGQGTRFEVLIPLEREGASKLELPQGEDDVPAAP
ncbi:MAG: HAMP domain-containing histidine kinase, partial [Acidobacteria bacterium]|nr:HAMP domain-containing histidine kinase [Acidobacteriota bacterium]